MTVVTLFTIIVKYLLSAASSRNPSKWNAFLYLIECKCILNLSWFLADGRHHTKYSYSLYPQKHTLLSRPNQNIEGEHLYRSTSNQRHSIENMQTKSKQRHDDNELMLDHKVDTKAPSNQPVSNTRESNSTNTTVSGRYSFRFIHLQI